jgi:hypothetical protein
MARRTGCERAKKTRSQLLARILDLVGEGQGPECRLHGSEIINMQVDSQPVS